MSTTDTAVSRRQVWLKAYLARTTGLLSTLALVYLFTYSIQSIWHDPGATWYTWLDLFGKFLWLLFAIDLLFRYCMTSPRTHFFRKNWLDTVTVVIPQLRALRALRAFTGGGIISAKGLLSGSAIASGIVAVILIVWVGGLMVLNAERGAQGAEITSLGDAVWWGFETITTVGYGDFVPVTALGRGYAVAIMFVGISVLGVVSATFASTLVKKGNTGAPQPESPQQQILDQLAELKSMVTQLEARLDGQAPAAPDPSHPKE
ncbi:MAG: potassium channel family protein [Candidatus Nanopelagicales bacterium]